MSPESLTIIGTGLGLAVLFVGLFAWLRGDIHEMRSQIQSLHVRVGALGERIASVEGKVDLLLHGLQIRILPPDQGTGG